MHWIGIGFLFTIGVIIALTLLPVFVALLPLAWQLKWIIVAIGVGILLILLAIAYPEEAKFVGAWTVIGFMAYGFYLNRQEKKAKKGRPHN